MNQRNVVIATIAGLMVISVIVIVDTWYSVKIPLTIHLRCEGKVSGILHANILLPNRKLDKAKSFELKKVCQDRAIELDGYQREKILHFTYESNHGEKFEVESKYGRDIQSDQEGFYLVLKINNASPFIENENI